MEYLKNWEKSGWSSPTTGMKLVQEVAFSIQLQFMEIIQFLLRRILRTNLMQSSFKSKKGKRYSLSELSQFFSLVTAK